MIFDARSSSRRWTMIDRAGELAEIVGLFDGRIAAADHDQRLVAEARQCPVADGTGADAAILVLLFRGQAEVVRPGAGGHDHGVRLVEAAVGGGQLERVRGEIDVGNVVGDDAGAEVRPPAAASAPSVRGR